LSELAVSDSFRAVETGQHEGKTPLIEDISVQQAKEVLRIEADSIYRLIDRTGESFSRAVELIYKSEGRVIVAGIGKSGLIGRKIVATLTSTGTQAIFLHPVEGLHGDLGIVARGDVLLALSNSGETAELNMIIASIHGLGVPCIAFTGNLSSSLARAADITIDVSVEKEACPFGLAPTSSSTAALAMGDALAVALIKKRNFREQDFYKFHPGGNLGLRLRAKIREVMLSGPDMPRVPDSAPLLVAIREMDEKNKGFVIVTDAENHLKGIVTDGDVRRFVRREIDFARSAVADFMTKEPKSIQEEATVAGAIEYMQREEITTLVVTNRENCLTGYVHLHDMLGRGGSLKIALTD
jgi:arabinose-5-phosphate isomerase